MPNLKKGQPMTEPKLAVIYARVSTHKQSKEANGLSSQIHNCQEFANRSGLQVVATFSDDISGKEIDRPGMTDMLNFLRAAPNGSCAVLVDDISRFSRNLFGHLLLRQKVEEVGGVLMSPSGQFGNDPHTKLSENMQAMVAEHMRESNAIQTRNRQRAHVLQGHWLWGLPPGYKHAGEKHSKYIARDEPAASIMQHVLHDYADGILETQEEVRRALNANPRFPKGRSGLIYKQRIRKLLENPLYAGYLHLPAWDIPLTKANHEPLISLETWQRIQDRLAGRAKVPVRKDTNQDFPLRGFVNCGGCDTPLRASWSKGRTKAYPYYVCQTRNCDHYGKSIKRADVEGEFETLLKRIAPSRPVLKITRKIFEKLWARRAMEFEERRKALKANLSQINGELDALVERVLNASQQTLIDAYERKIADLEQRKCVQQDKLERYDAQNPTKSENFEDAYRTALAFLSSPWILWNSDRIQDKKAVLKLAFASPLTYHRKEGYRTMSLSLPFKVLEEVSTPSITQNLKMVRSRRLELPRLAAHGPEPCASTNSATTAL